MKTILTAIGVTVATTIATKAVDAVVEKVQQVRKDRAEVKENFGNNNG